MMIVHYDLYTRLLVMISWDKQAGANMALSIKTIKGQTEVSLTVKHRIKILNPVSTYGTFLRVFLSSLPRFWMYRHWLSCTG